MFLSEVFDYLIHGELSQISIGTDINGVVDIDDYPKLITNINLGLIELYKRFDLKSEEIILQLYDQISIYNLHSDYAETSASAQPIKYIKDGQSLTPFNDNILLITHVYNEIGTELPLNILDDETSVLTPTPTTLQVTETSDENVLSIIYRARPDNISTAIADPSIVDVPLPHQFLEALTAYVAYRIFAPINVGEKTGDANAYYVKFETACALINQLGLLNKESTNNLRFGENGWL